MSTAITAPTYDPTSTATALAQKAIASAQSMLTNQTNAASATAAALTQLGSAISTFQTSLASLGGLGKSILAQSATLSDSTVASASAKSTATAGSYSLKVDQLATASQVSFTPPQDPQQASGSLTISFAATNPLPGTGASPITVDLSTADTDGAAGLSVREIAAAINNAPTNAGKVSAGVVTINGVAQLVLTSKNTGAANNLWVQSSPPTSGPLPAYSLGAPHPITQAQDATVEINGSPITQSSNTFGNIDGVSFTINHTTTSPVTLTVASDSTGTTANAQAFVDAYNKLKSTIDGMLNPGDPTKSKAAGSFAGDAGVKALQTRMVDLLRPSGNLSLASYGITANRDGSLSLDSTRLNKQLAVNPTGLDQLMGSASISGSSGVLGALNTYLNQWSDAANGQIQQRTSSNTKLQSSLTKRQDDLNTQYDAAYQRYLKQFTTLQTLQATMNSNVSMFDAMFGNDKSA